jgi:BirA family transcriptional regulator, biotin operon repressor / biotin---[acetyl-CoA-carboxylase] ligase
VTAEPALTEWADALEDACRSLPRLGLRHVRVLAETASTQDAAYLACGGPSTPRAGWLVVAGRQTAGRGRIGRAWVDPGGEGLAMTLTLPQERACPVRAGLAVCSAANGLLAPCAAGPLGLRWPNDVVERAAPGRKVAGVLIEVRGGGPGEVGGKVRGGVAMVGIGLNVSQAGFGGELHGRAASLAMLGATCSRLEAALAVLSALEAAAGLAAPEAAALASEADTLRGTRRRFRRAGEEHEGTVEAINPDGSITLRTEHGRIVLPAQGTSLVGGEGAPLRGTGQRFGAGPAR